MILSVLFATALLTAPAPLDQVKRQVTREYERVGRTAPEEDPALTRAARAVAQRALALTAARAASPDAIADAVSDAGAADPAPRAIVVRSDPPFAALDAFLARGDLPSAPANAVGAAWAQDRVHGVAVVLLAERKLSLAPFPRALPRAGLRQPLSGHFSVPMAHPELYLTAPDGTVSKRALEVSGDALQGEVSFPTEGRYSVEVVATSETGPEVVALFQVDVGQVPPPVERLEANEPSDPAQARREILARINRLRTGQGAPPLAEDEALQRVAQAYAEQMAREHFFAHVAPSGGTLSSRLHGAGVVYRSAGENLGSAQGPLAAEDGIERSPGHRKNLLDLRFTRLGVGIAVEQLLGRTQTLVVELLADLRATAPAPLDPGAALGEAIAQARRAQHLPPLRHDTTLDGLARARAQAALALDSVDAPAPERVEPQVFAALPQARRAAVDLFVTSDVRALPPSRALADPSNDVLGFAAIPGNSRRYGPDKFFVVIVYASTR